MDEVCVFFHAIGFGSCTDAIIQNNVDGAFLVTLGADDYTDFGLSRIQGKKIVHCIETQMEFAEAGGMKRIRELEAENASLRAERGLPVAVAYAPVASAPREPSPPPRSPPPRTSTPPPQQHYSPPPQQHYSPPPPQHYSPPPQQPQYSPTPSHNKSPLSSRGTRVITRGAGGAVKGATLGAIGGAIAGDARKGAKIGAAVGGTNGVIKGIFR